MAGLNRTSVALMLRSISRFSKESSDCGHDEDGDFAKENTCATGGNSKEKPPSRLPEEGSSDYKGFKLSKHESTQIGYSTKGGGTLKQAGIDTHRKHKGVSSIDPEGYERIHDNLKQAIAFIDRWHS
jgi:hypothetical protein